jgi:hypothetical protein
MSISLASIPLKGWKTVIFNIAMLLVTIADALPPKTAVIISGVGNLILRALATTPIFDSTINPRNIAPLLLFGLLLLPSTVLGQAQQFASPQNTIVRPTITITTATATTTNFSSYGMGSLVIYWKFGTVAGTFSTCTVQASTSIDNLNNWLNIGDAVTLTVTTGTANSWIVSAPGGTTVTTTTASAFGQRTRFVFACSSYGTSAPSTITVLGFPGASLANGSSSVGTVNVTVDGIGDPTDDKSLSTDTTSAEIIPLLKGVGYRLDHPAQASFTDKSGAITTGGTSQTIVAANASRARVIIQNPCTATSQNIATAESFFINFTTAASATAGSSIELLPCGVFDSAAGNSLVTTEAITGVGATTSHRWIAKEQ